MALRKVWKYNVLHFPNDVITVVGTHNFFVLALVLFYYIGGAVVIYGTVSLPFPGPLVIWTIAALVNIVLTKEFPGLFYLDDTESQNQRLSLLILGPINFLRAFCLGITFMLRVKSTYPFSIRHMFRTTPGTWSVDDEWIKAIQRSRDIEMPTLVGDIKRGASAVWRWLCKVGNTKIDATMVLKTLLAFMVAFVALMAIVTTWLKVTGKI